MDNTKLSDILPNRSEKLENIRRYELPRFFLDATDERKLFISQKLNSVFMLHILQLDPNAAKQLQTMISGGIIFLDTNFLYRLFGLDGDELREASLRLKELSEGLGYRMVVSPRTVEEYNWSIQSHLQQAKNLPTISPELAEVALAASYGEGFYEQYFRRSRDTFGRMSYEGYLKMFTNIDILLKHNGIEVDTSGDSFIRSNYIDLANEEGLLREYIPEKSLKHDQVINHDAFLRLLILYLRQGQEEKSYLETRHWLLTLDTRLVQYDRRVRPQNQLKVPYCVLSGQWMQLLRPFSAALPYSKTAFQLAQASSFDSPLFRLFKLPDPATIMDIITRMNMIDGMPAGAIVYSIADSSFVQSFSDTRDEDKREGMIRQFVHDQVIVKVEEEKKKLEEELETIIQKNEKVNQDLLEKIHQIEEHRQKEVELEHTRIILIEELSKVKEGQDKLQKKLQGVISRKSSITAQRKELAQLVYDLDVQKQKQQADLERLTTSYHGISQEREVLLQKYQELLADIQSKQVRQNKTLAILFTALVIVALELALWPWQLAEPLNWIRLSLLLFGIMIIEGLIFHKRKLSVLSWALLIPLNLFTLAVSIFLPLGINLPDTYGYVAAGLQTIAAVFAVLIYYKDKSVVHQKGKVNQSQPDMLTGLKTIEESSSDDLATSEHITEAQRWAKLGDEAMKENNLENAIQAFRRAGEDAKNKLEMAITIKRQREIETILHSIQNHQQRQKWEDVVSGYQKIVNLEPDKDEWKKELQSAKSELLLAKKYEGAIRYVRMGNSVRAIHILQDILRNHPNYRDARIQLERAIKLKQQKPVLTWENILGNKKGIVVSITLILLFTVLFAFVGIYQPSNVAYLPTPLNEVQKTAIAATKTSLAEISQDQIIFQEDFTSNSKNWPLGKTNSTLAKVVMELDNGVLRMDVTSKSPAFAPAPVSNLTLKNFQISVDVRMTKQNGLVGVAFKFRDQGNRYYQVRYSSDETCMIFYFDGMQFTTIKTITSDQIRLSPGVENLFSMKVKDSQITIYANGQQILDLEDKTIPESGAISIGVDIGVPNTRAVIEFDNLYIINAP
jgi:tetratricopeptide (TPR) repeat protein